MEVQAAPQNISNTSSPQVLASHPGTTTTTTHVGSTKSGSIIFTLLLCGFGLLLIYVIWRIRKLEMSISNMEKRHQKNVHQEMDEWFKNLFKNPEKLQYLLEERALPISSQQQQHPNKNFGDREHPNGGDGGGGRSSSSEVDNKGGQGPSHCPSPLSGFMNMCGMDILGSMMGGGGGPVGMSSPNVIGVRIPSPPPPKQNISGVDQNENFVEIVEIEEDNNEENLECIDEIDLGIGNSVQNITATIEDEEEDEEEYSKHDDNENETKQNNNESSEPEKEKEEEELLLAPIQKKKRNYVRKGTQPSKK